MLIVLLLAQVAVPVAPAMPACTARADWGVIIPLIFAGLGILITQILNYLKSRDNGMKTDEVKQVTTATAVRLDTIAEHTKAIDGHVNSERTELVGKNVTLQAQNDLLREMLADKKATAQLLAQAASHAVAATVSVPAAGVSVPGAAASLTSIDAHTKAIETNTAKTDAAVQDLQAATEPTP